jgi:hypothetical protein
MARNSTPRASASRSHSTTPTSRERRSRERAAPGGKRKKSTKVGKQPSTNQQRTPLLPKTSLQGFNQGSLGSLRNQSPYSSSPDPGKRMGRDVDDSSSSESSNDSDAPLGDYGGNYESQGELPIPLATQRVVQTMNIAVRGSNRSAQVQNAVTTTTARVPDATSAPITPRTRWTNIDADLHLATFDKTAVHDFVNTSLFPKLKFIAGTDISWGYSTEKKTICRLVMEGCNQAPSQSGMIWWETARKQTMVEIKRLRNDATKNMKATFLGM